MRILAALATVAACVVVSVAAAPDAAKPFEFQAVLHTDPKPEASTPQLGNDTCPYARDNECDEPNIGTGNCRANTDNTDCRRLREGVEDDSCQWANDGECDERRLGTGACIQATDTTDCAGVTWMRNLTDTCATSFNGVCEEPGVGNGACAARTDRTDCNTRNRPMSIDDHFYGTDDRVRVDASEAPWRFMGRFVNVLGQRCTATLIARDVILTAAHCVTTDEGMVAGGVFTPAAGGPTARTTAYFISPVFNFYRFASTSEIDGHDWALLRIDRPLGATLGFATVRRFTRAEISAPRGVRLLQAGYAWDTGGDLLSAHIDCQPLQIYDDATFAHACDTTQGDSGSGFIIRQGRRFYLVGLDSKFRPSPDAAPKSIGVSAAAFERFVPDFVAGRIGVTIR
jgi:protease YdgD